MLTYDLSQQTVTNDTLHLEQVLEAHIAPELVFLCVVVLGYLSGQLEERLHKLGV